MHSKGLLAMESTIVRQNIQRLQKEILPQFGNIATVIAAIDQSGGRALLVGGAVRDLLLGGNVKDLDIEIHGLGLNQLEAILKRFGHVRLVGKQFGVLRVDGIDVDWSIPRSDGSGRKPKVHFDPDMPLEKAFLRRDLTINAMGIDLITWKLVDPFNGQKDLQLKLLRAPDVELFKEDPLRLFRVMQFVGRLNMQPDQELNQICASMDISTVATERIQQEFEKLFLKSKQPSSGIRWLQQIGRLKEILPELHATIGVEQEPEWHPEGDVFEHSLQALDKAVTLECDSEEERFILMIAALCHDLGKVTTTQIIEGRIRTFGHDTAGVIPTQNMIQKFTSKISIIKTVAKLVQHHMMPGAFIASGAKRVAYKRLAKKLAPETNCKMLAKVAVADKCGRNPEKGIPLYQCEPVDVLAFQEAAQKCGVFLCPEPPILMGSDLLGLMQPGPAMGKLLDRAYKIQIEEGITDKDELKKRVLK